MNQASDMRLDIKPATPRPNKPAANKADKPASDSDFHKTLENAASSKQPQNKVEGGASDMQKPGLSKPEAQTDNGIMQEDTIDLQNAAAIMAAAMMPVIVMPEQTMQPAEEVPQMVIADTAPVTLVSAEETVQQPVMQTTPSVMEQTPEQQIQPVEVHTATEQPTVTVEPQAADAAQKVAEPRVTTMQEAQDKNTTVVTEAGAAVQPERPLFEKVEATPIKVAEPVRADEPDFPMQLAKQIDTAAVKGDNTIEVQLTPYELGKITIRLTVTAEGTQISMHSANSKTVRLLAEHAANIGAIVEQNQPGVVSVSVEQEQQNAQQQNQYTQQEHQGNGQRQQQQGHRHEKAQADDFIQQLRLGLAGLS